MLARRFGVLSLIGAFLALAVSAYALPSEPRAVPEASAYILAPMGIAAVVAAERRRRRMREIGKGVGVLYYAVKRVTDVSLSALLLFLTFPLWVIIALLVRFDSPGPILFKRRCVGKDGRGFDMFKFRSMVEGAEKILEENDDLKKEYFVKCKLDKDPRITEIGKLLRKTSLDELPQLINVFLGNMTFVGPRPIHQDEIEIYGPAYETFKTVTPGITGLWQTCGRSETSYEKRVEMDIFYIENRGILLDLWILMSTVPSVLLKRGAV